ncbi:MAG: hypothetical protein ACI9OU_002072 [Candidatus Promineifilaceae bacterium]|jgi:hypothetical protein
MAYIQSLLILLCATAITPWCLSRRFAPQARIATALTVAGLSGIALNIVIPVLLHLSAVPITTGSLCLTHVLFASLAVLVNLPFRHLRPTSPSADERGLLYACFVLGLLVIPLTPLAGIDTYKWQGLATNIAVEQNVPWLVHPLSLLGFTPRAYPSAQPLLLGCLQTGPLLGVETGFMIVSWFSGVLGLCGAFVLGQRLQLGDRTSLWLALLYGFSPVFMRYNHWCTGRGLFLAVYPAFLAFVLPPWRWRHLPGALLSALLLPLTHKTGLIALGLAPLAWLSHLVLPRKPWIWVMLLLAAPALLAALLLSPPAGGPFPIGSVVGFAIKSATRFGILIPLAALSLCMARSWLTTPSRAFVLPMILTLPLAYPADMYGAMLALPFIALAATLGLEGLTQRFTQHASRITNVALALTLLGALTVVTHRNRNATPKRERAAALYLNTVDPLGPFMVHAPGRTRVHLHAYLTGCPRFVLYDGGAQTVRVRQHLPPLQGAPADVARDWIDYLRNVFEVPDIGIDWYGVDPRKYFVKVDGQGEAPEDGRSIYAKDGIEIIAPATQETAPDVQ